MLKKTINGDEIKDFSINLRRKVKGILPKEFGGTGQNNIPDSFFSGDYNDLINKPNFIKNEFVANEDIAIYKPVTFMGTIIDTNNISHANKFFGISITNTLIGFTGNLISSGEISNPSWNWTQGDNIFLNGSDFSNISPSSGFSQLIGQAKNTTTIVLYKKQAIIFR